MIGLLKSPNMIGVYYYLVLLNAAVTVGAAVATYWRNRQVGFLQPLGMGFLIFAFWLVG